MTNPSWPAEIAAVPLVEGWQVDNGQTAIRSQARAGFPCKVRQIVSAPVRTYSGTLVVTAAEWALLIAFYESTCGGGAVPFDWLDFDTGASQTYRFVSLGSRQTVIPQALYRVPIVLEVVP